MDIQEHYQALYTSARTALDSASHEDAELLHVYSGDSQTGEQIAPPFVIYRQDVERPIGTVGGGASKVLRSSWVFSAYTVGLAEGLSLLSAIATTVVADEPTTGDGYTTTHIEVEGIQSLYENDSHLYATHLRLFWERSA